MKSPADLLIAAFLPSGSPLLDIVLPATVMVAGSALLTRLGVISENTALWALVVGALIHIVFSWIAVFLEQGRKSEKCHREAGTSSR